MTDKRDNTGNFNSGYHNSGDYNTGYHNSGDYNTGDYNTGIRNTGYYNSGNHNSGDFNSGIRNTGNRNSGDYNSGNRNSGYRNTGYHNSGDYNTGYHNSGDYNTGYYNSGNRNSGDFNSGDYNSGYFNSNNPKARLFNKDTDLHFDSVLIQKIRNILKSISPILTWIYSDNMSDEEKAKNPTYETTGGYLKKQDYKYCWQKGWEEMSDEDRQFIKSLPNFCPIIFEEITGINIAKQEPKKKITLELTQDQIDKIQDIINN